MRLSSILGVTIFKKFDIFSRVLGKMNRNRERCASDVDAALREFCETKFPKEFKFRVSSSVVLSQIDLNDHKLTR